MSILTSIFGGGSHRDDHEQSMWDAARRSVSAGYDGPPDGEPFIAERLTAARAELAAAYHTDPDLIAGRRALNQAVVDLRMAREEQAAVDRDTAPAVEQATVAVQRPDSPEVGHAVAEGGRAGKRRRDARTAVGAAERHAERINTEFQTLVGEATDRALVRARAVVAPLHRYMAIVNELRADTGLDPFEPLPDDLAERLVRAATARVDPTNQGSPR